MLKKLWLIFSQTVAVCAGIALSVLLWEQYRAADSPAPSRGVRSEGAVFSYSDAVERAAPSVVNIYTTQPPDEEDRELSQIFSSPSDASPLGSGVIVSRNGYILTNHHVVEGLSDLAAALSDGRQRPARLVGADPETDLALLKIEEKDLPAVEFGTSSTLHVGDVVLAIGNPFNVGQTVTMGIVSALGRRGLGLNSFEDFIQTDAAINRGNSGGALINTAGQLVGINTAIFSPDTSSGTSVGIGFAIPSSLVEDVLPSLMKNGKVRRGYLGLVPQAVTPEVAKRHGLKPDEGVLVAVVKKGAAAWAGGLREGDVMTSLDGVPLSDVNAMMRQVASIAPGKTVPVTFTRDGKRWRTKVTLQVRPPLQKQL